MFTDWIRPMAVASPRSAPDQAPAEIALLAVCCAVVIAVAAVVIRRGRISRPRRLRVTPDIVQAAGDAQAEADTVAQGTGGTAAASPGRPRAAALVSAAVAIALIVGAAAAVLVVHHQAAASRHSNVAAAGPGSGQDPATGAGAPPATKSASGKSPAKGAHAPGSPGTAKQVAKAGKSAASGSGSAGSSGSAGTPASPATTGPQVVTQTTPASAPGTFSVPSSVELSLVEAGVTYTASFVVTAGNVPVTYTAAEPSGEDSDYTISVTNASGTLTAAGQTATVTVTVAVLDGLDDPYVTMNDGATVTFTYPSVKIQPCPTPTHNPCP